MVKIETEHGRFEADDLRAAQRLARSAARAAKREAARKAAAREQAGLLAAYEAFRIHEWLADVRSGERESLPRAVRWHAIGEEHAPVKCTGAAGLGGNVARYETKAGYVTFEHGGYRVLGVLADGGGCAIAVALKDAYRDDPPELFGIGVHDGVLALQPFNVRLDELLRCLAG